MSRGMEGTALDSVGISGFPVLQKNGMDNKRDGPVTELGLSLDSGHQCTQRRLNNDSRAGANAGSRAEMMVVTTNTLSELVWSPHKGLSLKCVECSLADKKPSLLYGLGSSDMVFSTPKRITARRTTDDEHVAEGNLNSLHMAPHLVSETAERVNLVRSPTRTKGIMAINRTSHEHNKGSSGDMKELNPKRELSVLDINLGDIIPSLPEKSSMTVPDNGRTSESSSIKMDEPKLDLGLVEPERGDFNERTSSGPFEGDGGVGSCNSHTAGMAGVLASEVSATKQRELPGAPTPILIPQDRKNEGLASVIEEDSKHKMTATGFTNVPLLERHGSTAENDLQTLKGEGACLEVGMIVASQPADEFKQSPRQPEGILPKDWVASVEASPNKSIIPFYQREDKEMAFSNAEVDGKISKAEDDTHESIESSNSTGLFLTGKRSWSFEKKLIVENRKMKKQKQNYEGPLSPSFHRHASSFMNWISNMVKGLSKSNLDEIPSLALTIRPHHENGSHQLFTLHGKNQESGCTSMGFATIFKALYCPSSSGHDKNFFLFDHKPNEAFKELDLVNKTCENSSTPVASGSLRITRFSQKVSGLIINSPQCNQNVDASVEDLTNCSKLVSHSQNCAVSFKDQDIFRDGQEPCTEDRIDTASTKVQNYVVNSTGHFGSKRNTSHSERKFKSKLNPIQPSKRFKNSEAMASIFARRLDALKYIIPSEVADNASHDTMTCFFCGIRGHKLRDCSEITESEIEDLLKKINLYDGAKELSCLCIHCFQLNHWAIACPNTSSKKRSHSDGSSSLVNFRTFGKMLHIPGNDNLANNDGRDPSEDKDSGSQVVHAFYDGRKPRVDTQVAVGTNINKKLRSTVILNGRVSDLKPAKKDLLGIDFCEGTSLEDTSREFILNGNQSVSNFMGNESKENRITAFCNFVNRQIPAVPRGTFEAIKQLRLSRTDILKYAGLEPKTSRWMKSPVSLFSLEGFFLRLRLQKWEGQWGTGYYVACINGALREISSGNSKIPLCVNIGGFKCLVESRYVSNHDFLEDELMAWWCATLRGGAKLPSEQHLKMKLEERKNFEF